MTMLRLAWMFAGVFGASAAYAQALDAPALVPAVEEPTSPEDICLSNACSEALKDPARPKTTPAAIKAGDALAVLAVGGRPEDVLAALTVKNEAVFRSHAWSDPEEGQRWIDSVRGRFAQLADPSIGSFRFIPLSAIPGATPLGLETYGGGMIPVVFGLQRSTASGCTETVVVLNDGRGLAPGNLCSR